MKQSASIYRICPIDDDVDIGVKAESLRMPEAELTRSRRVFRVMATGRQRPRVGVATGPEMSDPWRGDLTLMRSARRRVEEK
ncbi:hypothetical protein [Burkholderia sp. BE12]|uniref:hypothetical protein n=1 Tax=Burkholderia sp. BE12 TaxID=2082394 RepID=UPI000CF42C22|nr:hypothetical protein [Burkholderia sp. BE12]